MHRPWALSCESTVSDRSLTLCPVFPPPADEDYTTATRTITFPVSSTSTRRCTSFDIIDDTIGLEGNESFTVRVGTSGPLSWVTIVDDDSTLVLFVRRGGEAILKLHIHMFTHSHLHTPSHTHTLHTYTPHTHTHTHTQVVEVEFQQPMYTVPESIGNATVYLVSDIETKTDLQVTVTASEKNPVEAQGT